IVGQWHIESHLIDLLHLIGWVRKFRSQFSVVGKQQEAGGVSIQSPYREDTLLAGVLHEGHHRLALHRIFSSGDEILRLVQQHVDRFLWIDLFALVDYAVCLLDLESHLSKHSAVDWDRAFGNQFIRFSARAYASIGNVLIQAKQFSLFLSFDLAGRESVEIVIRSLGIQLLSVWSIFTKTSLFSWLVLIEFRLLRCKYRLLITSSALVNQALAGLSWGLVLR